MIAQPTRRNYDGKLGLTKLRAMEYRLLLLAALQGIEKLIADSDGHRPWGDADGRLGDGDGRGK